MIGPVVMVRDYCAGCGRECELEVERRPPTHVLTALLSDRVLRFHKTRCLMCGWTGLLMYWSGEVADALRSAVYGAA